MDAMSRFFIRNFHSSSCSQEKLGLWLCWLAVSCNSSSAGFIWDKIGVADFVVEQAFFSEDHSILLLPVKMEEAFEVMADSTEFELNEDERLEILPHTRTEGRFPQPRTKAKPIYGEEDINAGPSSLAFLAESEKKEEERRQEEEVEGRRHAITEEERPKQKSISTLDGEQKEMIKHSLLKVVWRPNDNYSRRFSGTKRIHGRSFFFDWARSKEEEDSISNNLEEEALTWKPRFTSNFTDLPAPPPKTPPPKTPPSKTPPAPFALSTNEDRVLKAPVSSGSSSVSSPINASGGCGTAANRFSASVIPAGRMTAQSRTAASMWSGAHSEKSLPTKDEQVNRNHRDLGCGKRKSSDENLGLLSWKRRSQFSLTTHSKVKDIFPDFSQPKAQ
ncbi:hypothetical protein BV898_04355 [Hypsibius exemplaris]|uniref:Uncharacterized protein n=1 Tax=Hypsibius exemplaris TaxID=2072580 RepID=A0A1W0X2T5_HYPEX|nr:hypothetical protein BV898_04355 [Hypsibius exemplaris]